MTTGLLGPTLGARADGYGLTVLDGLELGEAEAFADAPGMFAITADMISGASAGRQLTVSVCDSSGALIAYLPRRSGVQGQAEMNAPGSGSLSVQEYDDVLADHPNLWDDGNLVTHWLGDVPIKTTIMEGWSYSADESGERQLTRSGRGNLAILDNAVLYPEAELRADSSEERFFNFGSAAGVWYRAKEWVRPKGVRVHRSFRDPLPSGWKFDKAQWIWSKSPERPAPDGANYFRGTLSLASTTRVRFWAAGDDTLLLMLDGEVLLRQHRYQWKRAKAVTRTLPAGDHIVAARVENVEKAAHLDADDEGVDNRSGFLFAAAKVNKKNEVKGSALMVSRPGTFDVRGARDEAPGWYPANVLQQFVTEAQARGVAGFSGITLGFTATKDATGRAWLRRIAQSYRIGTGGIDLVSQLVEQGVDVDMTATGELLAWSERGRDLSRFIALDGWLANSGQGSSSRVVNHALVKSRRGWFEQESAASKSLYGRREVAIASGGTVEKSDAIHQARVTFREYAFPEATYEVRTSSLSGPQPFIDYDIYDVVTAPTLDGRGPCRVLSISWTEDEAGNVEWTHQLYPEVAS